MTGRSQHPRTPRRGRQPTRAKGRPHVAQEDPETPGVCHICRRPMTQANDRHIDQHPPTDPAITEAEQRRLGERDQ